MNILFDNLESLLDAPNGIEKARELILQLAVQGKLTEQDLKDEPASELLKKIKKEKEKLIAEGKIGKQNDFEIITEDETPFELPNNWLWVRIGLLGEIFNGNSINKEEKSIKYSTLKEGYDYIGTKDVDFTKRNLNYDNGIRIPFKEKSFKIAHKGSVLICSEGGSAGRKMGIVDKDICFGNKLFAIEPYAFLEQIYIYSVYSSPFFFEQFSLKMTGIIGGISLNNFKSLLFPLPPFNEQKRIVEKVNGLMALLDELEEKRERRNQKRIKLNNASLEKLLTSKDDKELKTNWKQIEEKFSTLYSVPENVDKLKQAILQLAVQGKLVKQDPKDEPASELLKKIKIEKDKLIAEGKIKKQNELPPIKDDEKLFDLPKGWEWVRLGQVCELVNGRAYKRDELLSSGTPIIRIQNLTGGSNWYYSDLQLSDEKYCIKGDLLFSWSGTFSPFIWWGERSIYHYHIWKINLFTIIDKDYLYQLLKKIADEVKSKGHGIMLVHMTKEEMEKWIIPLPPLSEQKRIVVKVNELMGLCNTLEEKLTKKEATAEKLVGAVVNSVANKSKSPKDDKTDKKEKMTELVEELLKKHHKGLEKLK